VLVDGLRINLLDLLADDLLLGRFPWAIVSFELVIRDLDFHQRVQVSHGIGPTFNTLDSSIREGVNRERRNASAGEDRIRKMARP
jgi:hypothetical protein